MRKYLEWNKNHNLGMPLEGYLEENLCLKCLIFPFLSNIRSWVYKWQLDLSGNLNEMDIFLEKMFLTQNDLRNRKIDHAHHHKGTESVVSTSSHETISIFRFD